MSKKLELRMNVGDLTTTSETNDELVVEGYVNETNKWSHKLRGTKGQFIEKIEPGAFKKAINRNKDIHFLAEHDKNKILSSTRNGSLTLEEDKKGLKMKAIISKTSYGKDCYELIKDGILKNMSFGFNVVKDTWNKGTDGTLQRSVSDLDLFEVSVVTNPAYPQSNIGARGIDLIEEVEVPTINEGTKIKTNKRSLGTYKDLINYKKKLGLIKGEKETMENRDVTTTNNSEMVGSTKDKLKVIQEVTGVNHIIGFCNIQFVDRKDIFKNKETYVQTKPIKGQIVPENQETPKSNTSDFKKVELDYERHSINQELTTKYINDVDVYQFVQIPQAQGVYDSVGEKVVGAVTEGATNKITSETIDKTLVNNMYKNLKKKYIQGACWLADENTYNELDDLYGNGNDEYNYGILFVKGLPVVCVEVETTTLQLVNLSRAVQVNMEEQPTFIQATDTVSEIKGVVNCITDLYASVNVADTNSIVVKA